MSYRSLIRAIFISFVVICACEPLLAQENLHRFRNISVNQGLSHSTVYGLMQDSNGFIWISTQDGGLNRFDGYTFKNYNHDPLDTNSISSNNLNRIVEDSEGIIWIGSWGGGLVRFDPKTESFRAFKNNPDDPASISHDKIQTIYLDREGNLWIGTNGGGINRFDRRSEKFERFQAGEQNSNTLSNDRIWGIQQDRKGMYWIATSGGLNMYNPVNHSFTYYMYHPEENSVSDNQIRALFIDEEDNLWIGTPEGVDFMDRKTGFFSHFDVYEGETETPQKNKINTIFGDKMGRLWIGTQAGGITMLYPKSGKKMHFMHDDEAPSSLAHNDVRCITADRSGIIWIGTRGGGVSTFDNRPPKFLHYKTSRKPQNQLSGNMITSMAEDNKGVIWIGTEDAGVNCFFPQEGSIVRDHNLKPPVFLSSERIKSLLTDSEGNIWIGTDDGGLNCIDVNGQHFVLNKDSEEGLALTDNDVLALFEDSSGNLWIGTKSGLNVYNPSKKSIFQYKFNAEDSGSISDNRIYSITQDKEGVVWIGTDYGLNRYENGRFRHFIHNSEVKGSLSDNDVFFLKVDRKGNLWVGTGRGLNLLDKQTGKFKTYFEDQGFLGVAVYGIAEDSEGNLWLSTMNGIYKFIQESEQFIFYDIGDGVQSSEFLMGSVCTTRDGHVLFGGINGFNIFHPETVSEDTVLPYVAITNLKVFNERVKIDNQLPADQISVYESEGRYYLPVSFHFLSDLVLSYRESVFSIEYAAMHYSNPEQNSYAYKLENFEKDWNYVGNQRSATYTNLDPGEYLFRVKASNSDGIWNEDGAFIRITILPPWWETWWFRTLAIVILVSLFYLWYRSRIKRIVRQKEILEEQVIERTAEVVKQKEEIEKKNEVLQSQKEEIEAQRDFVMLQGDKIGKQREKLRKQRDQVTKQKEEIMDSIQYAKRIQTALLPPEEYLNKCLPEHFILFKPRDIVSGDFYWATQKDCLLVVAAADCTGHGVPGAFMSMLGIAFLNEIVNKFDTFEPDSILNRLRENIILSLRQTGKFGESKDGMDIALCAINTETLEFIYSGANNPVYIISDREIEVPPATVEKLNLLSSEDGFLHEIKADKMPIGFYHTNESFTAHTIRLKEGDKIYTFSDGYPDQFGGDTDEMRASGGKKFKAKNFKRLLLQNHEKPMTGQKDILNRNITEWKGTLEQVDDIVVIGMRL